MFLSVFGTGCWPCWFWWIKRITLPDKNVKEGKKWVTTPLDIAKAISKNLAANALIAKVNGVLWDMTRPLEGDCELQIFKFEDDEGRDTFWHSSAHILGQVLPLWFGFYENSIFGSKWTDNSSLLRRPSRWSTDVNSALAPAPLEERYVVTPSIIPIYAILIDAIHLLLGLYCFVLYVMNVSTLWWYHVLIHWCILSKRIKFICQQGIYSSVLIWSSSQNI